MMTAASAVMRSSAVHHSPMASPVAVELSTAVSFPIDDRKRMEE